MFGAGTSAGIDVEHQLEVSDTRVLKKFAVLCFVPDMVLVWYCIGAEVRFDDFTSDKLVTVH